MTNYKNQMSDQQIGIDEKNYVAPEPEIEIVDNTSEPKIGIVVGCSRLNVRAKPRADADVVCIINCDSKVVIDEENSTKNFYKICTEVGVEGYCMTQFINTSM